MSDVPPEIITSILIRLPVKSLLRARCVSKPWRSLIDSEDFIKQHLRHSAETNSNRTLLVESSSYNILSLEKTKLFYVDLDSLERLGTGDLRSKPQYLVGSCNGLVLFLTFSHDIVLWNPATRKLKQLPATPRSSSGDYCVMSPGVFRYGLFALGYDSKHDDYKVAWVDGLSRFLETKIYSLKTDSWKNIGGFPYSLVHEKPRGVYLNGDLHTVVRKHDGWSGLALMAIDIINGEVYEFPEPDFGGVSHTMASVEVIGGCLALVVVPGEMKRGALWVINSEVWVMKRYGVKESWCKLFSFDHSVPGERKSLRTLGYSKSGDEVLLNDDGKRLVWYDLRKKSVRVACVEGLSVWGDVWACVESLVSLGSDAFDAGVEIKIQNAQQGKKGIGKKKKSDDFLSTGFKLRL